ncbi:MAG: putative aldouronate transport system permease protein [Micromonosporaceae bacterium]
MTVTMTRRDPRRPVWEERPTPAGQAGKGVVLFIMLAVILLPLYSVVITSFSTLSSVTSAGGLVTVPHGLTLNAYRQVFGSPYLMHSLYVSLGVTAVGTVVSMVVSVLCAYGLSRPRSFGHRTILITLVITLFFSGGIVPTFLVVADALNGYDQYWTLILPSAVSVFNILVMRGFFSSTAQELVDAARVDGAGHWRTLWSVVLPTSRPIVVVMTLFYAVGYWNSFFNALLYLQDGNKWPLQMIIYTYTLQGSSMPGTGTTNTGQYLGHQAISPLSIQMAVVTLTLLPILLVYPFVQRHFTKGMLLGAIKG